MGSAKISGGSALEAPVAALVRFASAREAERRAAGVPAAARVLRELQAAGLESAALLFGDGSELSLEARGEIGRVAPRLSLLARGAAARIAPEAPLLLIDGRRLVPAETLRRFLSAPEDCLVAGGAAAARKIPPGAGATEELLEGGECLDGGEALDLLSHGAGAAILKATGKASDGIISRHLNRPISRRISMLVLRIPAVRPAHLSAVTALVAAVMFGCLISGSGTGLLLGGILFHAASVIDGVDGEIARATFRTSERGATLDSLTDMGTNLAFVLGLTVALTDRYGEFYAMVGGYGFAAFGAGLLIVGALHHRRGGLSFDFLKLFYGARLAGGAGPMLVAFFTTVTNRDFFAFLFALLILAGVPEAALYIFAGAATFWIMLIAAALLHPSAAAARAARR